MNFFDSIRDNAVSVVNNTMGYDATWLPSLGGEEQRCRVLFSSATEEAHDLDNEVFETFDCRAEFLLPDFSNLMDSVGGKNKEVISIDLTSRGEGIKRFYVQKVVAKYDGKTHVAYLIRKP